MEGSIIALRPSLLARGNGNELTSYTCTTSNKPNRLRKSDSFRFFDLIRRYRPPIKLNGCT